MKKKILITGVAGFIGSNLARMLIAKGYDVRGIDNLSAGTLQNIPKRVDFYQQDIVLDDLDSAFDQVDVVFHFAAKTCLSDCIEDPIGACRSNIEGTLRVLEAARIAKIQQMIYADTSAEYEGVLVFPTPVDQVAPEGVYAVSKRGGNLFCDSYRKLYGLKITTVRYFNVYGPVQDYRRVIPQIKKYFPMKKIVILNLVLERFVSVLRGLLVLS